MYISSPRSSLAREIPPYLDHVGFFLFISPYISDSMSNLYKKAVKKLSSGSTPDAEAAPKPKRSLSFKRKKKEKEGEVLRASSDKSTKGTRSSSDTLRLESKVSSPLSSVVEGSKKPKEELPEDTKEEVKEDPLTFLHKTDGLEVIVPEPIPESEVEEVLNDAPIEQSATNGNFLAKPIPTVSPIISPNTSILPSEQIHYESTDISSPRLASTLNDETQPLLQDRIFNDGFQPTLNNRSWFRKIVTSSILWYSLTILLGIIFFIYYTILNVDIALAVIFDVEDISMLGVTDDGLNTRFVGSVCIDYSRIPNYVLRNMIKLGGITVGTLTVASPVNGLKLFVKAQALDNEAIHLVDVFPPEIIVLVVDGTLTHLDFVSKLNLVKENLVQFGSSLNKLTSIDDENLRFAVRGEFETDLITKFFLFSTNKINFEEIISLPKLKFQPNFEIVDFKLTDLDDGEGDEESTLIISSIVRVDESLPFIFEVPSINWDIAIDGCSELVNFGTWETEKFQALPGSPIQIAINGTLNDLPLDLTSKCADGFTPLNKLVQHYVDDQPIHIVIKASSHQDNNLPEWLYYLLHYLNYDVRVRLPFDMISYGNLTLDSMDLQLEESGDIDFRLQSNVSMAIDDSFGLNFQIPTFSNKFVLKDGQGKKLISGESNGNNALHRSKLLVDFNFRQYELNLVNSKLVGNLVSDLLNFNSTLDYYLDLDIDDLIFESKYINTVLSKVSVKDLPLGSQFATRSIYDRIMKLLNITVVDFQLVLATGNSMILRSVVSILNPTPYSIDMPNEELKIGMNFPNSTQSFGFVLFKDLYIAAEETFMLDAEIHIFVDENGPESRINLEYLLSSFISGSKNISFDIAGNSFKNRPKLNDLVEGISIHDFLLPPIGFAREAHLKEPSSQEVSISSEAHNTPFIISSTIHVLTSEVELTIFNPISNSHLDIELYQAEAKSGEIVLGHLLKRERLKVPPGVHQTPRIPIKINKGMGLDALKRALNGDMEIDIFAILNANIGGFKADLVYSGSGLTSQIKL